MTLPDGVNKAVSDSADIAAGVSQSRADGLRRLLDGDSGAMPETAPAAAEEVSTDGSERELVRNQIRAAIARAERLGPIHDPLPSLNDEELRAPITLPPGEAAPLPSIPGHEILEVLGQGGQGMVYKARRQSTGRIVAVKVLPGGPFIRPSSMERFKREAEILAHLDHPHIVGILDRGRTDDGSHYLSMDYIEGLDLDQYVAAHAGSPQLTLTALLELFAGLARTLAAAHAQGVVHRDLKPGNIRIDSRGEAHILDFGFARLTDGEGDGGAVAQTRTGQVLGSLPWASPEQAAGAAKAADARGDVYSLGVLLYQMLTGEFPYGVEGPMRQVLDNIVNATPRPPSALAGWKRWGTLGRVLDLIVLRALAKSPEQRYANASDLAEDLELLLAGRRTSVEARLRQTRRRRLRLAAVAAALLVMAGVVTILAWPSRPPGPWRNSVGMTFAPIPAGEFTMGSPLAEQGRYSDEDQHHVIVRWGFKMGTTEVTRKQFADVMGYLPAGQPPGDDQSPVVQVTWIKASEFCQKLSQREGRKYRLPTEEEWEYACRAGTRTALSGGPAVADVAWYCMNSPRQVRPVAQLRANPWGLYDMHGNVREWCADMQIDYSEKAKPRTGPRLEFGPRVKVVRGGDVSLPWEYCRSARRTAALDDTAHDFVGFRVVLEDPGTTVARP